MDTYLISRLPAGATAEFVAQVEARGSSFLGPQYKTTVRKIIGGSISTVITIARNSHSPLPEYLFEDDSTIYVFSGYLVDAEADPASLKSCFASSHRDERPIVRSPGGVYSYVTVRRKDGQVCAGHSTPTLEPVYYAETSAGLHVGNNPLLVHAASKGMSRPEIDESFYLAALNAGVAIDGSTPFVGCYRLPPRSILVNQPATTYAARIRPAPRPAYGQHRISTFRHRRDSVSESLIRAASVLKTLPLGEFRVSGGKDSRLVAAVLSQANTPATPVNQNLPGEVEGQVADMVARVLGWDSCLRLPRERPPGPEDILRRTRRKIAFAGGLPAASSLQYALPSEGSMPGPPLIMGHAHLQRGGLNWGIASRDDALFAASSRMVSTYVRREYAERSARVVRELVNDTLTTTGIAPQTVSFQAYLQLTMNFQLQSLFAYVRNWNPLIAPMVDERFALLCENLATSRTLRFGIKRFHVINDLRSERIAMGVTQSLAPSLLEFPLAGGRYRCDGPEWDNFALRDPGLVKPRPISPEEIRTTFNTRRTKPAVRAHLWEQIEGTVVKSWGEFTCRPEIWRYVSQPNSSIPEGENQVLINQFVWSLYGLSVILGSDWWCELAATQERERHRVLEEDLYR